MAQALEHIGRQDNCSGLAYSISLLRDMLDPHSFCPRTFYDATKNILAGQLKSRCGQLMLRLKDKGNSKDLEPVYRIGIPQWFHLNVSFLAFNSHAGMDYPICDTSDIVLLGSDRTESTLRGKPYQQSILVEGAFLDVMSHHELGRGNDSFYLVMVLEYQVMRPYPDVNGSSLTVLLQPAVDVTAGRAIVPLIHKVVELSLEECASYQKVKINSVIGNLSVIKDLWTWVDFVHTTSLGYARTSQTDIFCDTLNLKLDEDDRVSADSDRYIWMSPSLLRTRSKGLKIMPQQTFRTQLQRLFTTLHIPWWTGRSKTVHMWAFYVFPFNYSGDISLNTVSIYMPKQNCRERFSDWLTVFDGPYAGIITPMGFRSPFPMLADKSCNDLMPGETYNSSIGDITLLWYNQFMANASIFFLYLVFKSPCPGQFCVMNTFPVALDNTNTVSFATSHRTVLHVLNFSAYDNSTYVRLKISTSHNEAVQNYISQCRTSGLFLVDIKLKASFCSGNSFKVLNTTMNGSGIQFGREALLVVKTYLNENFVFSVEYSGTTCFGMLNV